MATKLTLTFVNRIEKISQRTNKPFTSMSIKAQEYGDRYISGFGNKANENWKAGDVVEVDEVKEVEKDGKTYLNFEMPKFGNNGEVMKSLERVENMLTKLHLGITEIHNVLVPKPKSKVPGTDMDYPEREGEPNFDLDELASLDKLADEVAF